MYKIFSMNHCIKLVAFSLGLIIISSCQTTSDVASSPSFLVTNLDSCNAL